jgi:hypothetical protein
MKSYQIKHLITVSDFNTNKVIGQAFAEDVGFDYLKNLTDALRASRHLPDGTINRSSLYWCVDTSFTQVLTAN